MVTFSQWSVFSDGDCMQMPKHNMMQLRSRQKGLTLLETLIAVIIAAMFIPLLMRYVTTANQAQQEKAAATQIQVFATATNAYVQNNYAAVIAGTPPGKGYAITQAMLMAGNYLPVAFLGTNTWNQTYAAFAEQPTPNNIVVITYTTGGRGYAGPQDSPFADQEVPAAAGMIGGSGGFVSTNHVPGYVMNGLQGSYGGWKMVFPGNIPNPGPGHLAQFSYFQNGSLASDYLYRVAVPGQPQLNEMFTDLNMGGNNVNNAGNVQANGTVAASGLPTSGGVPNGVSGGVRGFDIYGANGVYAGADAANNPYAYMKNGDVAANSGNQTLSRMMQYATVVANGASVPMPTCLPSETPQIFLAPADTGSGPGANYPISQTRTYAVPSGSNWQVYLVVQAQVAGGGSGWIYPPAPYGMILALTKCS